MMMSKPVSEAAPEDAAEKPRSPAVGGVEDLERRLSMLGGDSDPPPSMEVAEQNAFAIPAPAEASKPSAATGKNALLVS